MARYVASLINPPRSAGHWNRPLLTRLFDLLQTWIEVARQRRHLAGFDDRMLKDIGFSRADVEHEVSRPFWDV